MRRNRIRLTESQLHKVIKESIKKILKEEPLELPMFFDIVDFVDDYFGWKYIDTYRVTSNRTGQKGLAVVIEPNELNDESMISDAETVKREVINNLGADRVYFPKEQPGGNKLVMVINYDDNLNEACRENKFTNGLKKLGKKTKKAAKKSWEWLKDTEDKSPRNPLQDEIWGDED